MGVVGAGANSVRTHIPNLLEMEAVTVVSVANRSRSSSQRVADRFGIETVHDDWQSLVADPGIDAVVVGTWPNMHHPVTLAALDEGKHVLCEARMAMDADQAREMLEAANRHPGLVSQLVPSPITLVVDEPVTRLLEEGHTGELIAIDVTHRTGEFADPNAPLSWRQDERLSGHNILTVGIWYEAIMRWVGPASDVTAVGKVVVPRRSDGEEIRDVVIPDHVDIVATMSNGAQLSMQMSSVTGLGAEVGATIFGTEGTIHFDGKSLTVGTREDDAMQPFEIPEGEVRGWRVEEDFIAAIRGEGEPALTDFKTGVRYMEFTDAVWRSMAEGLTVSLPSVETGRQV